MFIPYAVHILEYSISLPDIAPVMQTWLTGQDTADAEEALQLRAPRDIIQEDAYTQSVETEEWETLDQIRNSAVEHFEQALFHALNKRAIHPVQGNVILSSSIAPHPNAFMKPDDQAYEALERLAMNALQVYTQDLMADWSSPRLMEHTPDSLLLYKASVWLNGEAQAISPEGYTHHWRTLANEERMSFQALPVPDAAINPAQQPILQNTPYMGFSRFLPPKPGGLA